MNVAGNSCEFCAKASSGAASISERAVAAIMRTTHKDVPQSYGVWCNGADPNDQRSGLARRTIEPKAAFMRVNNILV